MSLAFDFLEVFYGNDEATNFTCALLRLIAKADSENLDRLRAGFPVEVGLFEWWMSTPTPPNPEVVEAKAKELEKEARS